MLYKLPSDIIIYIYTFDNTFKIIYDSCLNEFKIYYNSYSKKTYVYECIIDNNNNTKMKLKYNYIEDKLINNFNQYLLYCLKDK